MQKTTRPIIGSLTAASLAGIFCLGLSSVSSNARADAPATQPATQPVSTPAQIPPANDILNQMLRPTGNNERPLQPVMTPPAADAKSGNGAVPPHAPVVNVLREGTYLVDRTGRLTKSADGQQTEFTFDADGQALQDPPMVILPNLKLMAMENAVSSSNRDLRFRISGMVTEFKGRNYVLLEKVVVVPDVTQQF